jgi:hypothetical protein
MKQTMGRLSAAIAVVAAFLPGDPKPSHGRDSLEVAQAGDRTFDRVAPVRVASAALSE